MKRSALLILHLIIFGLTAEAQNRISLTVLDSGSRDPLLGAIVRIKGTQLGALTDESGKATLKDVPEGRQILEISYTGYLTRIFATSFPLDSGHSSALILLSALGQELEEVTVTATRTNSRIEDLPMKVEVLGEDDMNEENTIKPSSIASILGDLSIIHIQQTSQVTGSASVRMQGLDGKYTQLLRDGVPLYDGFSGSFGVLQIPPLDLKQVEVIKGSVSTLYGGGAISGLINLVSKEPTDSQQVSLTLNQSTLKETNINAYYAKKSKYIGLTMFTGITNQQAVDVNKDGFSDVPEIRSGLIHPRVFFYLHPDIKLNAGLNTLLENRSGGDMQAINFRSDTTHAYYERNQSTRNTLDMHFSWAFRKNQSLNVQGASSFFDRNIEQRGFVFQGRQQSDYYEASYHADFKRHNIVGGLNYIDERFRKLQSDSTPLRDYYYQTLGAFLQDGWKIVPKLLVESGLRFDHHNVYGNFFLPRIALLYKPKDQLSIRLSSGLGYKTPTIFSQQTLGSNIRYLLPLSDQLKAERSLGVNMGHQL